MRCVHTTQARRDSQHVYIDRSQVNHKGSALASPFRIRSTSKEGAAAYLRQYRHWLWTRLQAGDEAVWYALRSLSASTILVSSAPPRAHHGQVVMAAWAWGVRRGLIDPVYENYASTTVLHNHAAGKVGKVRRVA